MRATRTLVALLLALALPLAARANIPAPNSSTVDPVLVTSPDGSVIFHVTVRDFAATPVANSWVTLDFSSCPEVTFCATSCTNCNVNLVSRTVTVITNALGQSNFDLRAGGGCAFAPGGPGVGVPVYADGVLIGRVTVAPIDQDGDLMVTAADVAVATGKIGGADPTADFDHNGTTDAADVAQVAARLGVRCPGPVPVLAPTWGRLKSIYR